MPSDVLTAGDVRYGYSAVIVPAGARRDLLCEECERRYATIACDDCVQLLCATCCELVHMSGTSALEDGRSDHLHLRWGKLRRLRPDDMSSVSIAASRTTPDAPLEAITPGCALQCTQLLHQTTEEDLLKRGINLSVPTATEAPRINSCTSGWQRELPLHNDSNSADSSMCDIGSTTAAAGATAGVRAVNTMSTTRRTQQRLRCRTEYEIGDLVLFTAATADTVPELTVGAAASTNACHSSTAANASSIKHQQQQPQQRDLNTTLKSASAAFAIATSSDSSSDAQPLEMYGVVLDKPLKNHGEWGHAERRGGTDEHYYRLQVLCAATPGLLELDDVIAAHFGSSLHKPHRLAKQWYT
eukprot:5247-Heterococcus_DN1.PRE.10